MKNTALRIICAFLLLLLFAGVPGKAYAQPGPASGVGPQAQTGPLKAPETRQPAFNLKEELEKEKIVVKRSKYGRPRRDPFTNPLTRREPEGVRRKGPIDVPEDQQPRLLEEVKAQIENMAKLIEEKNYRAALPLSREIEDILNEVKWADQFEEDVKKLKEKFMQQKEILVAELYKSIYEQSLRITAEMNEAFLENKFDKVRQSYTGLEKLLSGVEGVDFKKFPLLEQLNLRAQKLLERAANREKLLKTKLEIRGIVWTPEERTALVNDAEVEEGDMLADEIYVREIGEDYIVFEYKSETDKRVMLGY